ncbi:hypothetical protein PI124_g16927 [Phytophthora idaei]|nr:hypothetical protein PI125_g17328 [Phytophthora idaei]KAG3238106.1 hypothetical protein PI124_g16927 [Phytophthora idaei]
MCKLASEAKMFRDEEIYNPTNPADFKFMEGDAIKVDRPSLTGESLSVIRSEGNKGYSGSVFEQGEIEAAMTSTGLNTFLGRTAEKIASDQPPRTPVCRLPTVGSIFMVSIGFWCVVKPVVRRAGCTSQNPFVIVTDGSPGVVKVLGLIVGGVPWPCRRYCR